MWALSALLRVDRLTGTMTAEVTVWTHWPVTDYIHSASLNLSSTQARTTLASTSPNAPRVHHPA